MNFKCLSIFTLLSFMFLKTTAQNTIAGNFKSIKGQTIYLVGYRGAEVYSVDSSKVDAQGNFELHFSDPNLGMGYLLTSDDSPYMVVLEKGKVHLTGGTPSDASSVVVNSGEQNKIFVQYSEEHGKREQALSAWVYLKNLYESDTLFKKEMQK